MIKLWCIPYLTSIRWTQTVNKNTILIIVAILLLLQLTTILRTKCVCVLLRERESAEVCLNVMGRGEEKEKEREREVEYRHVSSCKAIHLTSSLFIQIALTYLFDASPYFIWSTNKPRAIIPAQMAWTWHGPKSVHIPLWPEATVCHNTGNYVLCLCPVMTSQ